MLEDLISSLGASEIECLAKTAAELFNEYGDPNDVLSERQKELAELIQDRLENLEPTAPGLSLPDDQEVTLVWQTTETLEHEHTFTWGELREMLDDVEPGEDVSDRLGELDDALADYDNENADLILFDRSEIGIKEGT
jgi:hypothetical protein